MNKLSKIAALSVIGMVMALLNGWIGFVLLAEFNLSYWTWVGISIVGTSIARAAVWLNELSNELLTKPKQNVKITRTSSS